MGGLVGRHRGKLTASYATGRVQAADGAGGLVGAVSESGTVTASYWDTETSGLRSSAAGRGLTTAGLQRPTAYGGPYAAWNVDADGDGAVDGPWHLGTAAQYPALTLDVDGDGEAGWQELGRQLRAGPALTATASENLAAENLAEVVLTWTAADTGAWTPRPEVAYTVTRRRARRSRRSRRRCAARATSTPACSPAAPTRTRRRRWSTGGEAARSALVTAAVPCASR